MECEKQNTKCLLCLRPAEKLSDENKYWQQKIADLYVIYLKPKLATTGASVNWASLLKGRSFYCSQFCSECMRNGHKLASMNDQLIDLQCTIQHFIQNLSEDILKYRDELNFGSHKPIDSFSPYPEQFSDYEGHAVEINKKVEIIQEEVGIESNFYMENDEYISNHTSINSQDPLGNPTDSEDTWEDHVDSYDSADGEDYQDECSNDQDSSETTGETSGLSNHEELSTRKVKRTTKLRTHVVKHIRSRKIVDLVPRLDERSKTKLSRNRKADKRFYNKRARKQSFRRRLEEYYEYDFDMYGNQIKRVPEETEENEYDSDSDELDDAVEQQVGTNLPETNISSNAVKEHQNLHCTLCDENFQTLSTFETHMFTKHRRIPAQCFKCEQIFIDREARGIHMRSAHLRKDLICPACPDLEHFSNKYEYEMHIMTHNEEIPYECHKCHKKISNVITYCEHQKFSACANLGGQFECAKCQAVFKAKCLLLIHMTVFHKGKGRKNMDCTLFQCEMCEKKPMQKFRLEDHYAEHTKELIIPCDICGMSLQSRKKLNVHRKSHRPTVSIPCGSCDEKFKDFERLRSHIKKMHTEGQVITEDNCEQCGKKFVGKSEKYRRHIETCKFHICDICGKRFTNPNRLANHMKGHTEKPTCTICNKQFQSNAKLRAHCDKMHLNKPTPLLQSK